ncbi:TonB family protein [Nibribacter ruber]|uniref:TonB family protein n=1 Tax=Nibribacter ruber TaxID=2698458 RepID=A0A6P1P1I2_9BACT|nr:energy transducer TonB [Nibribacter ruber]QHL87282.1 TonB family protein [Nibribacter ruber]
MKAKHTILAAFLALFTAGAFATTTEAPKAAVQTTKFPVAAHYEGGQDSLVAHIKRSIQYPAAAKRNRVMGQCIVSFLLNEDGSTSNFKILKEVGSGTGAEAMRVVQNLKFKAPGYSQTYSLPVNFKL